jgi:hypothetical protein
MSAATIFWRRSGRADPRRPGRYRTCRRSMPTGPRRCRGRLKNASNAWAVYSSIRRPPVMFWRRCGRRLPVPGSCARPCRSLPATATLPPSARRRSWRTSISGSCAAFAVAETGSVLLGDSELHVNALAYLAQHLIVLLDPSDIAVNIHHAYQRRSSAPGATRASTPAHPPPQTSRAFLSTALRGCARSLSCRSKEREIQSRSEASESHARRSGEPSRPNRRRNRPR